MQKNTILKRKKIYVFVDESGQDTASRCFIVVSAVSVKDQEDLRKKLHAVEIEAKTHALKWNKLKHERRIHYLSLVLTRTIASGHVFIGRYPKPVPYFYPVASVIERAIKQVAPKKYMAIVHVDGANKKIARELTNALRANGISLRMVRGKTEQGEVLIRFVDMWAGCIRSALLDGKESKDIFERALASGYLQEVTIQNPHTEA